MSSYMGFADRPPGPDFRPYSDSSPFNRRLVNPTVHPQSVDIMRSINDYITGEGGRLPHNLITEQEPTRDLGHPIYYADSSDPELTISAGSYPVSGTRIHVPVGAMPAGGSDGHIGVVQPDGWIYEAWQAVVDEGAGTLTATAASRQRYDGLGIVTPEMRAEDNTVQGQTGSYFGLHAGVIRGPELEAGRIDHALFCTVIAGAIDTSFGYGTIAPGANGAGGDGSSIYPAFKGDAIPPDPENYVLPPMGAMFWLDMTESEIDSTTAPEWEKTIAKAVANYGAYFGDTGGAGFQFQFESDEMYNSMGLTNPFRTIAVDLGLTYDATWGYTFVFGQTSDPIPWASQLRVVVPPRFALGLWRDEPLYVSSNMGIRIGSNL